MCPLAICRAMKKETFLFETSWNRNKCFRNIKVIVAFGLAQSYLTYIVYIDLL